MTILNIPIVITVFVCPPLVNLRECMEFKASQNSKSHLANGFLGGNI